MTRELVGIRYLEAGPIHYCSPGSLLVGQGDYVIVLTDRGERLGWVVLTPDQTTTVSVDGPIRVVDRLASLDEVEQHRSQRHRAEEDVLRAQAAATRVDQRVRVASLTYALHGDFAELTYTAREGADLDRRLEREVARELDVAELRVEQVGDRDRAKALGGVGQCGRGLCCSTWMTEFPAISIKMAKDQGLAPNPSKISGVCGRLLCCLSFEVDAYREIVGSLPKVGKKLTTPVGKAKVLSINALTEMVRLRFEETGQIIEISTDAVKRQMGTTLRPDELDAEFEEALREKDRRRTEHLVAVLAPIDRPLRDTSAADGPVVDEEERARRQRDRSDRTAGGTRSSRSGGGGDRPSAGRAPGGRGSTRRAPAAGGPGGPGGPGGEAPTRRRGGTRPGGPEGSTAAPAAGESRSGIRITRRRAGAGSTDDSTGPGGAGGAGSGAPAEGGNRARRRRGGSGRGAGGGAGAAAGAGTGPIAGLPEAGGLRNPRPTFGSGGADGEGDGDGATSEGAAGRRRRRGRRGGRRRGGGEGGGGEGGGDGGGASTGETGGSVE